MKKKLFCIFISLVLISSIEIVNAATEGENIISGCSGTLGSGVTEVLKWFYNGMLFAVPAITLALVAKDIFLAVGSQKEEDMKKAQSTAIKRIIIGIVIFFVPILLKWILTTAGINFC